MNEASLRRTFERLVMNKAMAFNFQPVSEIFIFLFCMQECGESNCNKTDWFFTTAIQHVKHKCHGSYYANF